MPLSSPSPSHPRFASAPECDTLAPPAPVSSFNRGALKNSMRRIPSVLFHNNNAQRDKTPIKKRASRLGFHIHHDPPPPVPIKLAQLTANQTTCATAGGKTTKTKKPRKALADIFGWVHHSQATTKITPNLPTKNADEPPTVPPKDVHATLKKTARPISSTKSKSPQYGPVHLSSVPLTASRASMGDDPFMRDVTGAEVVDHVFRHGQSPSAKSVLSKQRTSVASSEGAGSISHIKDSTETLDVVSETVKPTTVLPIAHPSVPSPPLPTLVEAPLRFGSLGKAISVPLKPSVEPSLSNCQVENEQAHKTLNRDRTKSKIWGLLGRNKSKKTKKPVETLRSAHGADDMWSRPPMPPPPVSLTAKIDDRIAAATRAKTVRPRSKGIPPPSLFEADIKRTTSVHITSTVSSSPTRDSGAQFHDACATQTTPYKYPVNSGRGGVWESAIGTAAERPSVDGPRHTIHALAASNRLPKRKSLTGLFTIPIKKSLDRIRPQSPGRALSATIPEKHTASPPRSAGIFSLQPLPESGEESVEIPRQTVPSAPFTSRFERFDSPATRESRPLDSVHHHRDGVSSATDRLLDLVTYVDFSPASASSGSPAVHKVGSHQSLRPGFNGSPTPIRKVQSAVLASKISGSSLKPTKQNVSPLKLALHRAQIASNNIRSDTSPLRTSLVRKGMRNIFAPPSPVPKPARRSPVENARREGVQPEALLGPNRKVATIMPFAPDIPTDSMAVIGLDECVSARPGRGRESGLPMPPPAKRVSPYRPAMAPPAFALPPVPKQASAISSIREPMRGKEESMDLDDAPGNSLDACDTNARNSFDFTGEYARLDRGSHRVSFVEAIHKAASMQMLLDDPEPTSVVSTPSPRASVVDLVPSFHISRPSNESGLLADESEASIHSDDDDSDSDFGDDTVLEGSVEIAHVVGIVKTSPVRREPFKGGFAFQQHVSTMAHQRGYTSPGAPEPDAPLTDELPARPSAPKPRRGHNRGESGLSIATMSSIGSVIPSGNERDYTNYFDVNFPDRHGHVRHQSLSETIEEVPENGSPSRDSVEHNASRSAPGSKTIRPTTRRGHHRRNSSMISVNSLIEAASPYLANGPPISSQNHMRAGYVSRHRRNDSSDSNFGRSDWSAHRRNSSNGSNVSDQSTSHIVRPGLGDRMFQLDNAVKLAPITGSPADPPKHDTSLRCEPSWDSLLDATQTRTNDSMFDVSQARLNDSLFDTSRITQDSLFDRSPVKQDSMCDTSTGFDRSSMSCDSIFGPEQSGTDDRFFLRGFRPISTFSNATDGSREDDTFSHVRGYFHAVQTPVKPLQSAPSPCLQGSGENTSNITPLSKTMVPSSLGRQMLGSVKGRPQRPTARKPAHLSFDDPSMTTPGLTSSSGSEVSSRMSLDTNAASLGMRSRARPMGAGHHRQKSSAGVNIGATIREMPSHSSVKGDIAQPTIVGVDSLTRDEEYDRMRSVRHWVEWEREAVDEYRKIKSVWHDSEESKHALEDWKAPTSPQEIVTFLAQSSQKYQPLESLPASKVVHRRKSSLSGSRLKASPYGLPQPKPAAPLKPKRMSLETKYEKKSSTSSSIVSASSAFAFAFPDDIVNSPSVTQANAQPLVPPPWSKVFKNPASAPIRPVMPHSATAPDAFGLRKQLDRKHGSTPSVDLETVKRSRVASSVRREALGWGRRRASAGPEVSTGYVPGQPRPVTVQPSVIQPLQLKNGVINRQASAQGNQSKGKGKISVFEDNSSSAARPLITTMGQENSTIRLGKTPAGARSPKKRGLRQVASQPRALRI
ncbi:hypothetical protein IAU60_006497 [Kwoniella sp. DSM 27419]